MNHVRGGTDTRTMWAKFFKWFYEVNKTKTNFEIIVFTYELSLCKFLVYAYSFSTTPGSWFFKVPYTHGKGLLHWLISFLTVPIAANSVQRSRILQIVTQPIPGHSGDIVYPHQDYNL